MDLGCNNGEYSKLAIQSGCKGVVGLDYDLNVGDKISIMSTSGIETIVGTLPKQENYLITSIFDSGLADFDRNIAFLNIENF